MDLKNLSAPLTVTLGVTSRCNLNCRHCLAKNISEGEDLNFKEMIRLINELGEIGVFNVAIFGGEPLMRKDLFLLIEALSRYPIRLSMNTNGTLITKEIARRIKDSGIKLLVTSLDGASKKVAESMRGKGTFEKNVRGLENACEEGLSVLLSTTVTKCNYNDLRNIANFGKKIGVGQVRFNHVFYTGNALCYLKEVWLSLDEEKIALKNVEELLGEFGQFVTGSLTQEIEITKGLKKPDFATKTITVEPCGAATTQCAIRSDGWVVPCEVLLELKAGNVKENRFQDIWLNSKTLQEFRKPLIVSLAEMPECQSCLYQRLCFKGHRCNPYFIPGGKENTGLYCRLNRKLDYERICH